MEKSRLLQLLRTMSPDEIRALKKFARTPVFNQRSEVTALLDLLATTLKTERPAPGKPVAADRLGLPDDHRMRMAMSGLYKLALRFLVVQDFLADAPARERRLARVLRQRQLPGHAQRVNEAAGAALEAQSLRNADFLEEQYRLLLEKHRFALDNSYTEPLTLQQLSYKLDQAFLARKLWQSCFMLSHQRVGDTAYDFGLLDAALEYAAHSGALDEPAVSIYYYCYRALTNPTETAFFRQFKQRVLACDTLFPPDERRDLFVLAINFCIRQYNAGNPAYLPEQFDFYREGLARRYFLTDGTLSRYTYLNAATSAFVLHELDWAEQFIREYRAFLPEANRESLFSFNCARLAYQRRDPGRALQLLQKTDFKDLPLGLAAKTLQLKIYYELAEFDLLESHLQAFGAFVRRKKAAGYHRENYLNLLHFTQKLLETNRFDKASRAALRAEIAAEKVLAEREWLLEQL